MLSAFLPEQDVPGDFETTLNDYDIALKALSEEGKLSSSAYTRLTKKIEEAIASIKAAKSDEEAQELYNDIIAEIKAVTSITSEAELKNKAEEAKEEKAQQEKLAKDILNRYKALAAEEGLSSELNPHINEALKNIEKAKTAKEVKAELEAFKGLLNDATYGEVKAKFEKQEALLTAQERALAKLDAYESALDAIESSATKAEIVEAMKLARDEIMAAEESSRVNNVINEFENLVEDEYPVAVNAVAKKLVANTLAEGIKQLEAYKTGAYAEEKLVDDPDEGTRLNKTVKKLADEEIAALQTFVTGLGTSVNTDSYTSVEDKIKASVDKLNSEIKKIQEQMRKDEEAYLEAYGNALEELEIYASNAEKYGLTGEALEYIKSEVAAVKAKIASVDTAGEVNEAMSLFRNGIKQYSPAFDAYQVTETRKAVKEALEEYKELNDAEITSIVNREVAKLDSAETVDAIKKIEKDAMEDITAEIKKDELASAKLEARKEFLVYREEGSEYSDEVKAIALEAMNMISDAYSVNDVNTQVETYMKKIDEQLKLEKTSMQAAIKEARENALKEIAKYKEIATKENDTGSLNRIAEAEAAISSEDATVNSITKTKDNLIRNIKAMGLPLVKVKVAAIEFLKNIGTEYYYCNGVSNSEVRGVLKAYTEGADGSEQLSYDKLIKDAYINSQFEKAFNMVKDAEDADAVEKQKNGVGTEAGVGGTTTARGIIVKAIKQDLYAMETKRAAAITAVEGVCTDSVDKEVAKNLIADYEKEINAVDMTAYMADTGIFDKIKTKATEAIKKHIAETIKREALANLSVPDMKSKVESTKEYKKLNNQELESFQRNIVVSQGTEGVGMVSGDVRYRIDINGYSSNAAEQTGHFLTLKIDSTTAGSVLVTRYNSGVKGVSKALDDGIVIIRFEDQADMTNTKLEVEFYDESGVIPENTSDKTLVQKITYDFSNLKAAKYENWN